VVNAKYAFHTFDGPGDHAGGTTVNGINNVGEIVGFSANQGATTLTNFIRRTDGTFNMLNLRSPTAMALGVDSMDDVVGGSGTNAIELLGKFVFVLPNVSPDLKSQVALGIDDARSIVGQYTRADGTSPGFLLAEGNTTTIVPMGAASVNAQGVSKNGEVIGFFSTAVELAGPKVAGNPAQHGFLYDVAKQTYRMLPDPQQPNLFLTQYLAVNGKEQAAGYWQDMAGSQHGFVFDLAASTFTFMDDPDAAVQNGVTITQVVGINDAGELAGFFVDKAGVQHGFYAMPQ
jgi:hypothetical protein